MGAKLFNTCYPSQDVARDAFWGSFPLDIQSGSVTYVTFPKFANGVWNINQYKYQQYVAPEFVQWVATVPTFPECDYDEPFTDGVVIGWGIVGAMAIAYAVHVIRRAL